MDQRERFEAWMRTGELDLTPDLTRDGDVYEDWDTQRTYRGFQEGEAAALERAAQVCDEGSKKLDAGVTQAASTACKMMADAIRKLAAPVERGGEK